MNDSQEPVFFDPTELVAELRRLRERIPNYGQITNREAQSMVRVAHLDPAFVGAGISAIGAFPRAKDVVGWTGEELTVSQEEAARWTAVEDELSAMLQGVSAANLKRRHAIGTAVLYAYAIFRRLAKEDEHSNLIPYVDEMKRTSRSNGKSRKQSPK
jgi:hypothetical protein